MSRKISRAFNGSASLDNNAWRLPYIFCLGLAAIFALIIGFLCTPAMGAATFAYALLFQGVLLRRQRAVHIRLMPFGMAIDISLVLLLEITRGAVGTVAGGSLSIWQLSHVAASTFAVLLYFPVAWLGLRQLREKADADQIEWHRKLGLISFIFRTIGFALMFSMLK